MGIILILSYDIIMILFFIYIIMHYLNLSQQLNYNSIEKFQFTDSNNIIHKITYDKDFNHIRLYTKNNGKYYKFENDKNNNIVFYEDYLGTKYRCAYNSNGKLSYYEDYNTGERYGYSYSPNGNLYYSIDYNTEYGKWYYYDKNNKIYCTEDSNGIIKYFK